MLLFYIYINILFEQFKASLWEWTSKYSISAATFGLNSRIFVIFTIKEAQHLFEIYRRCGTNHISAIRLTSLLDTTRKDAKYIWENRKDLDGCIIRLGYLEFPPFLTKSKHQIGQKQQSSLESINYPRSPDPRHQLTYK